MPTINEVWEQAQQINANLVMVHNDLTAIGQCCGITNQKLGALAIHVHESNDWLAELRQLTDDGFIAMGAGFASVHARQDMTNALLRHGIEQSQAMICALEHISRNTCELLNLTARQTALQERLAEDMAAQRHMFASVHPGAALGHAREAESRHRIEACCPPTAPALACDYRPCPAPREAPAGEAPRHSGYKSRRSSVVRHSAD